MRMELVGRTSELAVLHAAVDAALGGRPGLVLCRGEPGIGKTRLAEELCASAESRGAAVVWGWAVEAAGAPFWPWRQVLRALGEVVDVAGDVARLNLGPDLACLAPEQFAGSARYLASSTADRFRQFDAVARLLRESARRVPLVVVIDDAHWADRPSLLLLQYVTRRMAGLRLLLVVNARDTEPAERDLLAELLREPLTISVELRGWDVAAVQQHLTGIVGQPVTGVEAGRVHAVTRGNPFFVAELGRSLAAGGDPTVPPTVREAIEARLARLSPRCVAVLRAASLVGTQFVPAVVAVMVDAPLRECLGRIDEAVAAGLVEPVAGGYRFGHELVRAAVETGLGSAERVRLHRRAGVAVQRLYARRLEPHLSDLARHWTVAASGGGRAADRAVAAGWVERAGMEAMGRLGYEEAARLFVQALDVGAEALDDLGRCRLLLALGAARHLAGDLPGRLRACLDAAGIARELGRPDLLAEAALVLEGVGEPRSDLAGRQMAAEAIVALAATPTALLARVTARFAETSMYLSDPAADPASIRAVELAEACGDAGALEAALTARHLTCAGPSGTEERAELAERMLALGRVGGTASTQLRALLWGIGAAFERGDLAAVARDLAPLAWCADQVGGPLARWQLLRTRAALAQAQARFVDVRQLSEELAEPSGLPLEAGTRLGLASAVGHHIGHDVAGSAALLVATTSDRTPAHAPGVLDSIGAAYVLAATGRHAEAAARYRELGPIDRWRPRPHVELVCHALAVDVAVALGWRDDVAVLRGRLDRHRGRYVVARAGAVPVFTLGPIELWLGRAAAHLGCLNDAVADLEVAAASAGRDGAAGFVVEAGCELAAALARRDRPGDTARARALATATATDAGILGMARFAAPAAALRDRLDATAAFPLTHREREVAPLVADGLTNREIAQRLQLSERTAQNHVQHILTKLDLRGRRQIAAWLAQRAE